MLTEKRLKEIVQIVEEKNSVTVQELTELLDTSESTIRRDLTILHKKNRLVKVHGGALAINYSTKDDDIAIRQDRNQEAKKKIGVYAAGLILPGDFVFVDAGSSTEIMVEFITEKNAVFVTNGISQGMKLAKRGCTVYILGGELKGTTNAIIGSETIQSLQKYNFTKAFLGTNGITVSTGFTTPQLNEAMIKRTAMKCSKENFILSDVSKFNKIATVTFGDFRSAEIITTELKEEEFLNYDHVRNIR